MSKHKISRIVLFFVIAILFSLLVRNIVTVHNNVKDLEVYSRKHIHNMSLLNHIRSSLAYLSLSQLSYTTEESESKKYLAKRKLDKLTQEISQLSDSVALLKMVEPTYLKNFVISANQLLTAHEQVISYYNVSKNDIEINTLNMNYRSVFDIFHFHINTVQDLALINMNSYSNRRYSVQLTQIIVEIVVIALIALIIILIIQGRKHAENLLAKTESYFNDVVNSSPSALIGVDNSGSVFQMNQTALKLSQIKSWRNRPIEEVFNKFSCLEDLKRSLKSNNRFTHREIIESDDVRKIYAISTFPFTSSDRLGAVVHFEDITEQDLIEEKLRQTLKMNAIGQLAGGVAHDFNNTLGAIMGAAELLLMDPDEDEKQAFVDMILNATTKASGLTKKLLTFARKNHKESIILDMNDIISSSLTLIRHSINKNVSIDMNLSATAHMVTGDSSTLQNLLLNLGINASHAMPKGGSIVISSQNIKITNEDSHNFVFEPKIGEYIKIDVSDTGTGISKSNLKKIFEPFFTTKEHGTGIGLASVYGTVQEHDGTIDVKSELGEGTTFSIYLPVNITEHSENNNKEYHLTHGEGVILVVDDEDVIRRTLTLMLKKMGYTTIIAKNGVEAVEIFKRESAQINLIMLDMIMPVMNGLEALKEIRNLDANIPVIISSGYAHSEEMEEAQTLNISATLSKPYRGNDLSDCIATVLTK